MLAWISNRTGLARPCKRAVLASLESCSAVGSNATLRKTAAPTAVIAEKRCSHRIIRFRIAIGFLLLHQGIYVPAS
jgi:hypothetical protein